MLYLQSRIHFQEIESPAIIQQEFHSSSAFVLARSGYIDSSLSHLITQLVIEDDRGCFLYYLLVSSLDTTLPLKQVNNISVLVCKYLDFDMPG